jgi:t-SNARE complex subunit (syntaxin)
MNQGDLLDRVESQVIEANDQISQGNNHITTAIEYLKELQQRRCCLAIILLIIIGIAVGVGVAGGLHKFG